jgi:hypothetical protein
MSKDNIPDDFRIKMREVLIPALEDMVQKEEEHREFLLKSRRRMLDRKMHNSIFQVDQFLKNSEQMLGHYKLRLQQYKDYIA